MNETIFWEIVERTRDGLSSEDNDGNMDIQRENLESILSDLSKEDLKSFNKIFTKLFFDAYRWDLWGAAFVIGGGCSDDSFMDFRSWLISMGKEVYETGMQNPDELVSAATDPTVEDCFF